MERLLNNRYLIKEILGKGGSGQVYQVWDTILEKYWAMKVFDSKPSSYGTCAGSRPNGHPCHESKTSIAGTKEGEAWKEIKALKSLNHPGFPHITDVFIEDNMIHLIMDYVEGITLEEYYGKCCLRENEILEIGIQIADALLYMHEGKQTLLYLDLKPSNILINSDKKVKMIDMGSVRIKGDVSKVSGTPGFASPEQRGLIRKGEGLNEQSDVYSLGMVLFAMIQRSSCHLPIVENDRRRGIFVRRYNPAISKSTEGVIEKATRGCVEKRYGNIREMKADMEASLRQLKKNKATVVADYVKVNNKPQFWKQERNIICCAGKKSLYFPMSLILLFLGGIIFGSGLWPFLFQCHAEMKTQGNYRMKEEMNDKEYGIKKVTINKPDDLYNNYYNEESGFYNNLKKFQRTGILNINDTKEANPLDGELEVNIRDRKLRKILVKKGERYRVEDSLLLEIPREKLQEGEYDIKLLCYQGDRCKGEFQILCEVIN